MNTMNTFRPKDVFLAGLVCFSLALVFCLVFSISTSPLYNHYGYDSIVFQLIGKYWAQGNVPYIEFWDHKGPYIFFINCLGYLLTDNKIGVFLIQVLHLSICFYFLYKSFKQVNNSKMGVWLFLLISAVWLASSYDEGNLTEEYLLPWISATIFFTIRWAKKREHMENAAVDPRIALLSGIILGISLMTRLTSGAITCGILLYLGILLLKDRRYRELLITILLFLLGFIAITTPFLVYFYRKGALEQMWFGTIIANISFAAGEGRWGFHLPSIIRLIIMSAPFPLLIATAILLFFKEKSFKSPSLLWLFATIPYALWLLTSKCFTHYTMIAIPLIPALAALLQRLFGTKIYKAFVFLLLMSGTVLAGIALRNSLRGFDYYASCKEAVTLTQETVPDADFDSFIAWEVHPAVYLELQAKPCYSHFFAQEWHASAVVDMAQEILDEFSLLSAKYVLVSPRRAGRIQAILDQHYVEAASSTTLNGTVPSFSIYRRKDQE